MAHARHGDTDQAHLVADRGRNAFRRKIEAARAHARNHIGPVWDAMVDKAIGDRLPWVRRYPWEVVTKAAAGGRWVTIGGTKGADGKRHGGSPVFVRDGRIAKWHPSLVGRKIGALGEAGEHGSHRSQLAASRE